MYLIAPTNSYSIQSQKGGFPWLYLLRGLVGKVLFDFSQVSLEVWKWIIVPLGLNYFLESHRTGYHINWSLPKELTVSFAGFCEKLPHDTVWDRLVRNLLGEKQLSRQKVQSTSKIIQVKPSQEKTVLKIPWFQQYPRFCFLSTWHLRFYDCCNSCWKSKRVESVSWNQNMFLLNYYPAASHPIGSMYGILFTYIYHKNQPNGGKYIPYMDPMGMKQVHPIVDPEPFFNRNQWHVKAPKVK